MNQATNLYATNWFACPQPNPAAETRLFLFPYAGGGPAAFGKWPGELPGTLEARIAHYPGRGSRFKEPAIKHIGTLVERLSQAVQPILERPFAFFGHSLGSLVAFELTRQLQRQNLPGPRVLFVSACDAPGFRSPHLPIHALPDGEFLQAVQELDGFPTEAMQVPELRELLIPVLRADFEAVETYRFTQAEVALSCPIVAFGGLDDPRVSREGLEGWAALTRAGFRAQTFPGDHFFLHTTREAVIATISEILRTAHAKS